MDVIAEWFRTGRVYRMPDRRQMNVRWPIIDGGRRLDDPLYPERPIDPREEEF